MNTKAAVGLLCLITGSEALGSITWDGARFIRNGLAEWYDDIGGNNVSNIYFESDGELMYTGNASTGGHWLNEDLSAPGVYEYTFLASNNLGNTGITTYNMELNFNGNPEITVQATAGTAYTGGAFIEIDGMRVEVTRYGFDIVPLSQGGIDLVGNLDSSPDGAADIVGYLQFTVSAVPTPGALALFGFGGIALGERRRR